MEVIHITAECFPLAKVGGLADVLGSLPKYLNTKNSYQKVIVPFYDKPSIHSYDWIEDFKQTLRMGHDYLPFTIFKEKHNTLGFDLYAVHIPGILNRPEVYGYNDDNYRFLAFQLAVLEWLKHWEHQADILHCHDHQTALIPFFMQHAYDFQKLQQIPTILTIHNAAYQGKMGADMLPYFPAYNPWKEGLLWWNDCINSLASGIKCAWRVSTVSLQYMGELSQSSWGLENLIQQEFNKCLGILNGIDDNFWNPKTDQHLVKNYGIDDVIKGKQANKQFICDSYGLDTTKPLIGFIGRFAPEKGADLLAGSFWESICYHQHKVNYIVLGSGNAQIQQDIEHVSRTLHQNVATYFGYNEDMSHKVYAACDFLLIPSRTEPCGLNQMYACRYGSIPIVRAVGGLSDTIVDYDDPDGFGIRFIHPSVDDILHAISRALYLWDHSAKKEKIQKSMMKISFSWEKSAEKYLHLYEEILT